MKISDFAKRILFKERATPEDYLAHLRNMGMRIGERVTILRPRAVTIDETRPWLIQIGNDVQIANGVIIMTHGFDWSVLKGVSGEILGSAGKVTIGNNVFIGVNSIILKGVSIGDNTIIGAGAVVTHDIPGNSVAAGNPARVVMSLEDYKMKRKQAQYAEASELVRSYREVYGKEPDASVLAEFFWLFTTEDKDLPESWEAKMQLVGNRKKSGEALQKHEAMFNSLEEFLRSVS